MVGEDEARLVAQARLGRREAASTLFRRHWPTVWQVAYAVLGSRAAADDAAQEAMISAFAALESFDEQRPLGPWLKRIAFNQAVDELRRRRVPTDVDGRQPDRPLRVADDATELATGGPIAAAVARLSPERRTIIVLHYWLDCTQEQIAEILDLPPGTVASRLGRALTDLRSVLEERHVHLTSRAACVRPETRYPDRTALSAPGRNSTSSPHSPQLAARRDSSGCRVAGGLSELLRS